jgi:hypothetical protein
MAEDEVQDILDALDDIKGDSSVPKISNLKLMKLFLHLRKQI